MAKSNPFQVFGICKVVLYDVVTREFFGPAIEVAQSSSFSADTEQIENSGGCSAFPYGVANGRSSAEGSIAFNELSPWMLAKMAGGTVVINGAEAGGNVSALADAVGVSITNGTTGIAVAAKAGSESSLAFGQYRVVAKTANTVDVFRATSSIDDSMVVAADLDVSVAAEIASLGLEFTLAGTTALVVGDVAMFDVRPINTGSAVAIMGRSGAITPEVGILAYAPNQDGNLMELDIYRAKFAGLPMNMTSNEWMAFEASFKALYSSARNGVYEVELVSGAM
ncbi:MAG: hypothetical protein KAG61_06425 [Bacteriovoracaceae bacterium]|nr:hypothetical protein [Bacteriovoracaceae bacterium]